MTVTRENLLLNVAGQFVGHTDWKKGELRSCLLQFPMESL